ncbi:MAG: type III pantothenate kinase [Bacteroidales bacterium]|nr:type III pantothenate kinase [Bacteroidales bacterium]
MVNIVIDSGNTKIKIGIFENNSIMFQQAFSYTNQLSAQINTIIEDCKKNKKIIISAVKDIPKEILLVLNKHDIEYTLFNEQTNIPILNLYESPSTLGKDRLAAIIGANQIFPKANILAIDAGTAITFDIINEYNEYIGGNISPGLNMRFKALHQFTDKLPLLEPNFNAPFIAKNTNDAILAGVQNGILFEINEYINQTSLKYHNLKVILTGGDAFYFDNKLKKSIFAEPNLVLLGLNRILDYNA